LIGGFRASNTQNSFCLVRDRNAGLETADVRHLNPKGNLHTYLNVTESNLQLFAVWLIYCHVLFICIWLHVWICV